MRHRSLHSKVKTGCQTCKSPKGRVKCDEERPLCRNCLRANRKCVFAPLRTWMFELNKDYASQAVQRINRSIPAQSMQPSHTRALLYFRERTIPTLGAFSKFTRTYWNTIVPLIIEEEPAVRNLTIALASRHESLGCQPDRLYELSLLRAESYSTAVRQITRPDCTVVAAVQSCLFFLAHECLQNPWDIDPATSVVHLGAGLRILSERNDTLSTSGKHDAVDTMMANYIEPMCLNLEMIMSMFITPIHTIRNLETASLDTQKPDLPPRFKDLQTARGNFFRIYRWQYHYRAGLANNCEAWTTSSPGFKLVRQTFLEWYSLAIAYSETLDDDGSVLPKRLKSVLMTMINHWSLMLLALVYSGVSKVTQRSVPTPNGTLTTPVSSNGGLPFLPDGGRMKTSIVDLTDPDFVTTTFIVDARSLRLLKVCDWTATGLEGDLDLQIWPTADVRTLEDGSGRGVVKLKMG